MNEKPNPIAEHVTPTGHSLATTSRILVTVGPGGVGKTTVAAALGLLAARAGRHALVMTIDPARRLAVSLGLSELSHDPVTVPTDQLDDVGVHTGTLEAMMLDAKRAFDEVVSRHAPDSSTLARIMQNKLYQELSTRLAGGQEYAAVEKLYEVMSSSNAQLLVLDTPPTVNAIDFLEAPKNMVALIDGPAVKLFVRSYQQMGNFSFKLLSFGAAYAFKRIARFVGGRFLDDVATFFSDFSTMLDGFRARAAEVSELLAQPDVGFVIVSSPAPQAIDEAIALSQQLHQSTLQPVAYVVNRVHPMVPSTLSGTEIGEQLVHGGMTPSEAKQLAPMLLRAGEVLAAQGAADAEQIERLAAAVNPSCPLIKIPLLSQDVHDITTLARICAFFEKEKI